MQPYSPKISEARLPYARWHRLPLENVTLTSGFWAARQDLNRRATIPHGYQMLEKKGTLDNFRVAAGLKEGQYRGTMVFLDSDVYKWLEAVAYELQANPDPALRRQADEVIEIVAAAQQPDGYLNTYFQLVEPDKRWTDLDFGHELYCAGHMFEAAVAYARATGAKTLLEVATRFADLLVDLFGSGKQPGTSGHPEIELALVKLYHATGNAAYLDLAGTLVDRRGKGVMRGIGWMKAEYHQDRVPVREEDRIEGHAVRAMYLNAGVADLYLETGEEALLRSLERQWQDMARGKLFLTGGLGARYEGEAFGEPYELPSDQCYCETCAAIGSVFWNWRMLQITGEARFADLIERALYNGVLSGVSLDGDTFFYMNPLLSRGSYARRPWQTVACCPPNLMRLLTSLPQYFATHDDRGLQVHLYGSGTIRRESEGGQPVALSLQTDYPWDGRVTLKIEEADGSAWQLRLRRPDWCPAATLAINGEPVENLTLDAGYIVLERQWQAGDVVTLDLPMEPYLIEAHPRVDAVRDSVAIGRGPVVYCVEAVDHPDVNLMDIRLDERAPLRAVWRDDVQGEAMIAVETQGAIADVGAWGSALYRRVEARAEAPRQPVQITAIPYYAWANRGPNAMRVWLPRSTHR